MTSKHVIVEIDLDGNIVVDAIGFKGAECEKATKAIEEALGVKTGETKKAEWYSSALTQQVKQHG